MLANQSESPERSKEDRKAAPSERKTMNGGILHVFVDKIDRSKRNVSANEPINDPTASSSSWGLGRTVYDHQETHWIQCSIQLGDSDKLMKETAQRPDGVWKEEFKFIVQHSDMIVEIEEGKTKAPTVRFKRLLLNIKVNELCTLTSTKRLKSKEVKKTYKGRIDVLKAVGSVLDEDIVQHGSMLLSPKEGGSLRLRFLWEPTMSVYDINHMIVAPALLSWSQKQNQSFGIINIQIIKAEDVEVLSDRYSLTVRIGYGLTEDEALLKAQNTKYSHSNKNPFWDEGFDFLANNTDERIFVYILDSNNKNKVIAKAKIDCWHVLAEKVSLSTYQTFKMTDNEEKSIPTTVHLGFVFYPTTTLNCFAKRNAFEALEKLNVSHTSITYDVEASKSSSKDEAEYFAKELGDDMSGYLGDARDEAKSLDNSDDEQDLSAPSLSESKSGISLKTATSNEKIVIPPAAKQVSFKVDEPDTTEKTDFPVLQNAQESFSQVSDVKQPEVQHKHSLGDSLKSKFKNLVHRKSNNNTSGDESQGSLEPSLSRKE
jgi:hypothetical protein